MVNVLWDSGSTLSFITFDCAKHLNLHGKHVRLEATIIGGEIKTIESEEYTVYIKDAKGCKVPIKLFGINEISCTLSDVQMHEVVNLFPWIDNERVRCPVKGNINLMIGFQYAAYHPKCIANVDHLLLLENFFFFFMQITPYKALKATVV